MTNSYETRVVITLDNAHVENVDDGQVVVSFPSLPLSREQQQMLEDLFPNTERLIGRALSMETILAHLK